MGRIDSWFKRLVIGDTLTSTRGATQVCLCTFQLTEISLLDKYLNANGARKEVLTNRKRCFLVRLERPKSFRFDQRKPQRPVDCSKTVCMTCNSCKCFGTTDETTTVDVTGLFCDNEQV
ncbi:hypothetical protein QTP88_022276 [Uroleucon formosanum]